MVELREKRDAVSVEFVCFVNAPTSDRLRVGKTEWGRNTLANVLGYSVPHKASNIS